MLIPDGRVNRETGARLFVGSYTHADDCLTVVGIQGEVQLRGTLDELTAVTTRLDDARSRPLQIDGDRWGELDDALLSVGAALDVRQAWLYFQLASSNPPSAMHSHDPMGAYNLPRHGVLGRTVAPIVKRNVDGVNQIAALRASADLTISNYNRLRSFERALALAADAYTTRPNGTRPVASGGALYPLHFWVVRAPDSKGRCAVRYVDHDAGAYRASPGVDGSDFSSSFVADPGVEHALKSGAAVIVVGADPTRVTYKYGNRGWRYAIMEVGAVSHHMHLDATEGGTELRPVAGFVEERLGDLITGTCYPLLTLFVGESTAHGT